MARVHGCGCNGSRDIHRHSCSHSCSCSHSHSCSNSNSYSDSYGNGNSYSNSYSNSWNTETADCAEQTRISQKRFCLAVALPASSVDSVFRRLLSSVPTIDRVFRWQAILDATATRHCDTPLRPRLRHGRDLRTPTLVVHGAADVLPPAEAGHPPCWEAPVACFASVHTFLAEGSPDS